VQLQEALVAIHRLSEIMDLETERVGDRRQAQLGGVQKRIEFQGVSFHYGCRANVLHDITLHIPAGATVALVGESGSGKSTLLKLLTRFYDPTQGRILIDGVDVRDLEIGSLRSRLGVVAQEPFIFKGTIRDNIAVGQPRATMDDIVAATRTAGLEAFITGLPQRYNTVIGERGTDLSGGQRQRLAIARALLRTPDILIFDEATSHLDTATERAIHRSLHTALRDKTVLLVAHRLSTVKDADIIYVLHEGRIAEHGSHHQLLVRGGLYASLWRTQTESLDPWPPVHTVQGFAAAAPATAQVNGRVGHAQ
jgi:ATP-binding cassette subfamily B protein